MKHIKKGNSKQVKHKKISKINKTKTKSMPSKERVSSGIRNLDPLIENGFEKNSVNLIVGSSGSGKSIFAMQFLIDGMKKGEKCLYVTFEEKKAQFYSNMQDFGWNLEEYERKGLFTFLQYTPEKVKAMLEEGGGSIESIILTKKVSRVAIDSLSSFALLFEDELEKREAALNLFNMIRDWKCTSIVTLENESKNGEKTSAQKLEFESDSIIAIYYARDKGERKRFLEILKMRSTEHSNKIFPLEIDNSGLFIGKKALSNTELKSLGL